MGERDLAKPMMHSSRFDSPPGGERKYRSLVKTIIFCQLAFAAGFFSSAPLGAQTPPATDQLGGKPATSPQPSKPAPQVPWKKVPEIERKVLAPLEKDWETLPSHQQRRLMRAAKEYPKMESAEKDRFQDRLKNWSRLTPEQRSAARESYKALESLPPEKKQQLHSRWQKEKATAQPDAKPSDAPPLK